MSQKKLRAIIKQWHEPPRRSWARRQNKVDELPIDQTAWTPDRDDIQLPVRVAHSVSLSLIPRDLEQGGRPIQRSAPDSAADIHGEFRERLPMMLCVAFALASTVALVLLYLDSPFRTRRDYETGGGDQNATSTQPLHHLQSNTFGHHDEAGDQETVILVTRTMSMLEGNDNVSVVEERAVAVTTGHRV